MELLLSDCLREGYKGPDVTSGLQNSERQTGLTEFEATQMTSPATNLVFSLLYRWLSQEHSPINLLHVILCLCILPKKLNLKTIR